MGHLELEWSCPSGATPSNRQEHFELRALLVYANPYIVPSAEPYGLEILRQVLSKQGVQASIYCPFMYGDYPYDHAARRVTKSRPQVVAFSIRNLDDCTAVPSDGGHGFEMRTSVAVVRKLIRAMRAPARHALFVLGGSGFSSCPEELLAAFDVDHGFVGPGEDGLMRLIEMYERDGSIDETPVDSLKRIPNLVFRRNGLLHRAPATYEVAVEKRLGRIARVPGFMAVERFAKGYVPIRTKTGCSLRCSYCVVPANESLSLRPIRNVVQEIRGVAGEPSGTSRIFFADGEFNLPSLAHASSLLRKMIRAGLHEQVSWVAYFTVKPFSPSFVNLMIKSNCKGVSLSVDSFSDAVLRKVGKNFCQEEAARVLDRLLDAGFPVFVNIMIGLPGETRESIEETLRWVKVFATKGANFFLSAGARVYPGTPLAKQALEQPNYVCGSAERRSLEPALYCEPASPSALAEILIEKVGHLSSVNIMHLNGQHREPKTQLRAREALTRGYYFLGGGEYDTARKWLRKVAGGDSPFRVDALWVMALMAAQSGNKPWQRRYLSQLLKCENYWPEQIDYDAVRELLELERSDPGSMR